MAFRDSINDLMFRFYERFKQNNNRLPVSVDADINVGDVQIGTVKQGGVDEGAEPWKVKAEELEQKIDALKQSIESGVQLKGQIPSNSNRLAELASVPALLDTPTYDGSGQAVHPSVVRVPRGFAGYKYWMAMTPFPNSNSQLENPSILASNDGLNWEVPPGITNPIEPTPPGGAYNRDAEVVYDRINNVLRFYWGNSLGQGWFREMDSSGNLAPKTALPGSGTRPFASSQSSVVCMGDKWLAFSSNVHKAAGVPFCLTRHVSDDGIEWRMDNVVTTNLFSPIWHLGVTYDAAGFHFLASAYPRGNTDDKILLYGYSIDGTHVEFDSTPILMLEKNTFYERAVYKSHLVPIDGSRYRIYLSGLAANGAWRIGYVDVRLNNPGRQYSLQPRERTLWQNYELRDTNRHFLGGSTARAIPEFRLYPHKSLMVYNTLDKDVKLTFLTDFRGSGIWDPVMIGGVIQEVTLTRMSLSHSIITGAELPILEGVYPRDISCRIEAAGDPPSDGQITIQLKAWG